MHILEQKIRNARAGGRTARIPSITAGLPSPDRFRGLRRSWPPTARTSLK